MTIYTLILLLLLLVASYYSYLDSLNNKLRILSNGNSAMTYNLTKYGEINNINTKINSWNIFDTWDINLPLANSSNNSLKKIKVSNRDQIIGCIYNNGVIGSKKNLWDSLEKYYGREEASIMMPQTYVFPKDLRTFKHEFNKKDVYLLKSEEQRQAGIKLTNAFEEILDHQKTKYVLVQKLIPNSITFNNHKINFRIYLFVKCDGTRKTGYIYNDGIVSYAKNPISNTKHNNKITFSNSIASFYESKKLYDNNWPITINKLKKEYALNHIVNLSWDSAFSAFGDILSKVLIANKSKLCSLKYKHNNTSFQLFGADFIIDTKSNIKLLEINLGPGMTAHNIIDNNLRNKLHRDIIKLIINNNIINFKQIWDC